MPQDNTQDQALDPALDAPVDPVDDGQPAEDPFIADDPELRLSNGLKLDGTSRDEADPEQADDAGTSGSGPDDLDELDREVPARSDQPALRLTTPPHQDQTTQQPKADGAPAADGTATPAIDPFDTDLVNAEKGLAETLNLTHKEAEQIKPLFKVVGALNKKVREQDEKLAKSEATTKALEVRAAWAGAYSKVAPHLANPERFGTLDFSADNLGLTQENIDAFTALDKEVVHILDQWKSQNKPLGTKPGDRYTFAKAIALAERRAFGAGGEVDKRRSQAAQRVQKSMTLPPGRARPAPATNRRDEFAGHPQAAALRAARDFMQSRNK